MKRDRCRVFFIGLMLVPGLPLLGQIQPPAPCRDVAYVDATQEQKHPRELPQLEGIVSNALGVRMTGACVAVFSEERKLIAVVQADEDGRFQVPDVDPGSYRLVVRAESVCPANVRVRIVKRKIIKKSLVVHMQAAGYGCSSNGASVTQAEDSRLKASRLFNRPK